MQISCIDNTNNENADRKIWEKIVKTIINHKLIRMLFCKLLSTLILLLLDFLLSLEILLSSCTWIILILLCSIWKCWHLYTAYLTLLQLLLFYRIWMNVCILCCWFVFYVWGELYAFWVVAFVAVLCYLTVCVCI